MEHVFGQWWNSQTMPKRTMHDAFHVLDGQGRRENECHTRRVFG